MPAKDLVGAASAMLSSIRAELGFWSSQPAMEELAGKSTALANASASFRALSSLSTAS